MTSIIIPILCIWGVLGFFGFLAWSATTNKNDTANIKQFVFVILLCGPFVAALLIVFGFISIIPETIKYIYNKLGE